MLLLISMLLTLFAVSSVVTPPGGPFEPFGPRSDRLVFKIYPSCSAAYAALDAGEIDYVDCSGWVPGPETGMAYYYERGMYQIDMNCNQTFAPVNYLGPEYDTYLGKCNPTHDIWFRRALSYLANKDEYVTTILNDFGGTMDTVLNPFPEYEDYYYADPAGTTPYDPAAAAAILDAHGWDDVDDNGIRNYPEWMVPGRPNIDEYLGGGLIFVQTTDEPYWMEWSHKFALEMEALGIPVWEDTKLGMDAIWQVIVWLQYHLYAGGWNSYYYGRDPTFMKDLWHSELWKGQGYFNMNYAHYNNSLFDEYAIKLYYAEKLGTPGNLYDPPPPGEEGAYYFCQECQRMIKEEIPCIPLVYYAGFKGYHKTVVAGPYAGMNWTGMQNERGYGVNTWWTPMNAHPEGVTEGGTIVAGLSSDVESLNIVTTSSYIDYNILDSIFCGLTDFDPNNPTFTGDIDWMASCHEYDLWDATSIMDPDLPEYPNATRLTYYLRPYAYWHDGTPVTAEDIGFTIDFIQACGPTVAFNWAALQHVYDYTIINPLTIKIKCKAQSIYFPHLIGDFPYMPKHIWENVTDSEGRNYTNPNWDPTCVYDIDVFTQPEYMIGCGPYKWTGVFVQPDSYTLEAFKNQFHLDEEGCAYIDAPGFFHPSPVQFQGPTDPADWVHLHPCYCSNVGAPYILEIAYHGVTVVFWLDNKLNTSQTVNINIDVHVWMHAQDVWFVLTVHKCFQNVLVEPGCHMIILYIPLLTPEVGPWILVRIDHILATVYLAGYTPAWSESVPGYREYWLFWPSPVHLRAYQIPIPK